MRVNRMKTGVRVVLSLALVLGVASCKDDRSNCPDDYYAPADGLCCPVGTAFVNGNCVQPDSSQKNSVDQQLSGSQQTSNSSVSQTSSDQCPTCPTCPKCGFGTRMNGQECVPETITGILVSGIYDASLEHSSGCTVLTSIRSIRAVVTAGSTKFSMTIDTSSGERWDSNKLTVIGHDGSFDDQGKVWPPSDDRICYGTTGTSQSSSGRTTTWCPFGMGGAFSIPDQNGYHSFTGVVSILHDVGEGFVWREEDSRYCTQTFTLKMSQTSHQQ